MEKIIVLASGNAHKLKELKRILKGFTILSLKDIGFTDEIVEDGTTFEENALIKARAVHNACGYTVIADDSGICVDYLNGAPGVYSARFSGQNATDKSNNEKLLKLLNGVENRRAEFVSAAAAVFSDGTQIVVRGVVEGSVATEYRGSAGFGYDPLFICDENQKTYAQMSEDEKNSLSHRKRAFEKLNVILQEKMKDK